MAEKKKSNSAAGILFVGFLFIGMGLGFYFNNYPVGLFVGMGVGFLAMAGVLIASKDKS